MQKMFPPVNEQMDEIRRGAVDLIDEGELAEKLERSLATGKPISAKFGADPSSADLHIGHAVPLRKLRTFQDLVETWSVPLVDDHELRLRQEPHPLGDRSGAVAGQPPLLVGGLLRSDRPELLLHQDGRKLHLVGRPDRMTGTWIERAVVRLARFIRRSGRIHPRVVTEDDRRAVDRL